jgi:hypothetical protein
MQIQARIATAGDIIHWCAAARCAREVGLIRTWPSLAALLTTPLLDGALAHHAAVADAWPQGPPGTLDEWREVEAQGHTAGLQQVDTWLCGCVAWLLAELGKADSTGEFLGSTCESSENFVFVELLVVFERTVIWMWVLAHDLQSLNCDRD